MEEQKEEQKEWPLINAATILISMGLLIIVLLLLALCGYNISPKDYWARPVLFPLLLCVSAWLYLAATKVAAKYREYKNKKAKKTEGRHCFWGAYPRPCTEQCMEEKKSASIEELAEAIVLIACNVPSRQIDIDFINDFAGKSIDEPIFNSCINEIIIFRAAISSLLSLIRYKNHPQYSIIADVLGKRLYELFNNFPELWELRLHQYGDAFADENPIETVSTMLQFILEQTIARTDYNILFLRHLKDIAKLSAYPSYQQQMRCAIFVGSFIHFFTTWINGWEITTVR